ncbi:MAG: (Fe-S)-binding protein, partial [Spirochaetes bacterium]|nr:(Fe-S)-binding protein [Spirochaetota bacterium]
SAYENQGFRPADQAGDALILASEAAEIGGEKLLKPVLSVLKKAGVPAKPLLIESGAIAYSLGALELASKQALRVIDLVNKTGVEKIIVDGPRAMYAIKYIYPLLDISWPEHIAVTSISEELYGAVTSGKLKRAVTAGSGIIFHDSRSACALADEPAGDQAIQPDFQGPETVLGRGEVYEAPRRLMDALGMERIFSVWSRSLCKSCGADDGLWLTYPELAADLAEQLLRDAENLGAEMIVTDSLLCAEHLKSVRLADSVGVRWLPELFL